MTVTAGPVQVGTVEEVTDEHATLNALGVTVRLPAGTLPKLKLADDAPEATVSMRELLTEPDRASLTQRTPEGTVVSEAVTSLISWDWPSSDPGAGWPQPAAAAPRASQRTNWIERILRICLSFAGTRATLRLC